MTLRNEETTEMQLKKMYSEKSSEYLQNQNKTNKTRIEYLITNGNKK